MGITVRHELIFSVVTGSCRPKVVIREAAHPVALDCIKWLLQRHDNLADLGIGFHVVMRLGDVLEHKGSVDHRAQLAAG